MRPRRVRNPIKATAREPINRPDTYERFPKSCQILNCEQQPTHTKGPEATQDPCADSQGGMAASYAQLTLAAKRRPGSLPDLFHSAIDGVERENTYGKS